MNTVLNSEIHLGVCKITYELDEKALKIATRIHQFSDEEVRRTIVGRQSLDAKVPADNCCDCDFFKTGLTI